MSGLDERGHPDEFASLGNLGVGLLQSGEFARAIQAFESAIRLAPRVAGLHYNLANAHLAAGAASNAILHYQNALAIDPAFAQAHNNMGVAYRKCGRFEQARECFRTALSLDPGLSAARANLGIALVAIGSLAEGIGHLKEALLFEPGNVEAISELARALQMIGEWPQAFALYEYAIKTGRSSAALCNDYAAALMARGFTEKALVFCDLALSLDPCYAEAHVHRAQTLVLRKRFVEAIAAADRGVELQPESALAWATKLSARRAVCDWHEDQEIAARVLTFTESNPDAVAPLLALQLSDDPLLQQRVARSHAPASRALAAPPARHHERLRIAYMSGDLNEHPVGHSLVEVLERHDRRRFELIAVSLSAPDDGPTRRRIRASCERFIDAATLSDTALLAQLEGLELDILIDLGGYTTGGRPQLGAARPATLLVNYLGYPGTLGSPFFDYLIADRCVIPSAQRAFYDERIVWLPSCFFPSDTTVVPTRPRNDIAHAREQHGLPQDRFVYCGFCNTKKLSPAVFAAWMRIVGSVDGSLLWLQASSGAVRDNLRRAAAAHGQDPRRLVFAERVPLREDHLARLGCADLLLDTWPYNGHSLCRDALWTGLPVLARSGRAFASRVSASLLQAVGMEELITEDWSTYHARACELARDPARLNSIRTRLMGAPSSTLFDTASYTRQLERAYQMMWERAARGEAAVDLLVPG
jgi:predicted O-linked N-acetylglucosamine transferase (SPINDLY family)